MMKKLTLADLDPKMMQAMSGMESTSEIIAFCESEGFEISEEGANRILAQFKKVDELSLDDLGAVAGGRQVYLSSSS